MCHGTAGQGDGQQAELLIPKPNGFMDAKYKTWSDGRWFWRTGDGVGNSSMPPFHVLLSDHDLWDVIGFVKDTYVAPKPTAVDNKNPVEYDALTSPYDQTDGALLDGKTTYETFCAGCHGAKGKGDGPLAAGLAVKPKDLSASKSQGVSWWYWKTDQGVPGTTMAQYRIILPDRDIWNAVWYARQLAGVATADLNQ
jgi:mono/diheme cytochrome c family protein